MLHCVMCVCCSGREGVNEGLIPKGKCLPGEVLHDVPHRRPQWSAPDTCGDQATSMKGKVSSHPHDKPYVCNKRWGGGCLLAFVRDYPPSRSGLKAPRGGGGLEGGVQGGRGGGGHWKGGFREGEGGGAVRRVGWGRGPGGAIWGGGGGGGGGGHRLPFPPLALPLTTPSP